MASRAQLLTLVGSKRTGGDPWLSRGRVAEAKAGGLRVCAADDPKLGVVSVPALCLRYWHSAPTGYLCGALCFPKLLLFH